MQILFIMKKRFLLLFTILFVQIIIAQTKEEQFENIVDSVFEANPAAVGLMFHVEAPDQNISWTYCIGHSEKNGDILNKNQPTLIASNTKTYVAAAILKLVEADKIQLDQSIEKLISEKTLTSMTEAKYDPSKITIKQLLSHNSGITDYVDEDYFNYVKSHPNHEWTRDEQIALAMSKSSPKEPGTTYAYGDINFLLLTEIIEHCTDLPFYNALRELLEYEKNEWHDTWFIKLEDKPEATLPLAEQYWDEHQWESYDVDPSYDLYGGGGIASTTKDVALFYQALFTGNIMKDKTLLTAMCTPVLPEQSNYGLGAQVINFFGETGYYHGGFWGTDALYMPNINTTIAAYTLAKDHRELNATISEKILEVLKEE